MALLNINHYSYYLGMETPITVLLPEKRETKPEYTNQLYPVLYLLHGHSDDCLGQIRKTSIELMIRDHDRIVVMPSDHRSFYTDGVYTHAYESYIAKELPIVIANFFHTSLKKEDHYIVGLSMGGYGALKLGLKYTEVFGHIGCMSIASDMYGRTAESVKSLLNSEMMIENINHIFQDEQHFYHSENDIKTILKKYNQTYENADTYMCCGKQDPLFPNYLDLKEFILSQTTIKPYFDEIDG